MSETLPFAVFETSSGAKISRLPLEVFPQFGAYVYVVQKDDLCVLIDSGSGTDLSHEGLLRGLGQTGLTPLDLTHVLLTHAHIDHYGGLARLRPLTEAKFGLHELDVQTVVHHEAQLALTGKRLASFLADTGLADDAREQILSIYHFSKAIYQSTTVDFTYEDCDMRLGPFEFIHLPGHCAGHVAIRIDDVVFCGDMVVEGVTPHLAPEAIHAHGGVDHYLESLARLQHWAKNARLIFNGHDDVIVDLPERIHSTKQNILRRMGKAVEALSESCTIEDVCRAVYGEMQGYNQMLVIEKTGAYVEHLYEHGLIEIVNADELEQGQVARYRRLQDELSTMNTLEKSMNVYVDRQVPM